MNEEQYKRYRKMCRENINCLFQKCDTTGNAHFLIDGSTGTHYKVSIYKNGQITCTCPDFMHNSKNLKCVCKHCLYIIYTKLQLWKTLDHPFFARLVFTPDEIAHSMRIVHHAKNDFVAL